MVVLEHLRFKMSKVVLNFVILMAAIQISCQDMLDKIFRSDVWHCKLNTLQIHTLSFIMNPLYRYRIEGA